MQLQPNEIAGVRKLINGTEKAFVGWKGLPEWEEISEDYAVVDQAFSDFHLADNVKLVGGVLIGL